MNIDGKKLWEARGGQTQRSRTALLMVALLQLVCLGAWAQQNKSAASLVLVPAKKMEWKMTLLSPAGALQNKENIASVTTTKNGEVGRVVIAWRNGTLQRIWRLSDCTLVWHAGTKKVFVIQDNHEYAPYPLASQGFYGIANVKPGDELPIEDFDHTKCRHFNGALTIPRIMVVGEVPDATPAKEYEAWFDVQTGLPKGYREGGKTFVFQFSATPEALQLPPEYQSAAEKYEAELRHAGLLP
ncbi:MAG: hypothetical protein ACFUZC_12195 [Chthoniobacteraceae bacterium]